MPSAWSIPKVEVRAVVRGPGTQASHPPFDAQSLALTWTWGSQPDEGILTFVRPAYDRDDPSTHYPPIVPGAFLQVSVFGKTFYGIVQNGPQLGNEGQVLDTVQASSGHSVTLRFQDTRLLLKHDVVFGVFNRTHIISTTVADARIRLGLPGFLPAASGSSIIRLRYYRHLLPNNHRMQNWSSTLFPLSAREIVQYLLGAETVNTPWLFSTIDVPEMAYEAVYDIDCEGGRHLDEALQEVSDKLGLTFTVMGGAYRLVWARKGSGNLLLWPERADDIQLSNQLSGQPTRIYVVGDRNLYLCMNLTMHPDWNANYEIFSGVDEFTLDIYNRLYSAADPGDPENMQGHQQAAAKAREITVGEYAALRNDSAWLDHRRFAGRSRLQMPVLLYLVEVVWRAFRPPAQIPVNGSIMHTQHARLVGTQPARVRMPDPATGVMMADLNDVADGNGLAAVLGYNVGADLFRNVNSDQFHLDRWLAMQNLWTEVPFQIDDNGEEGGGFILFNAPVLKVTHGDDEAAIDLVAMTDGHAHLRADYTRAVPSVRASLTFEWDIYRLLWPQNYGNPSRDAHANVPGLHGEYIVGEADVRDLNGVIRHYGTGQTGEVYYSDGESADAKAAHLATTLLQRQFVFTQGGFKFILQQDDLIPDLTGLYNRMSLQCSSQGQFLLVEFSTERPNRYATRPTELDRQARERSLLPGQEELRKEARGYRMLGQAMRQHPGLRQTLDELLQVRLGNKGKMDRVRVQGSPAITLPIGTPLTKKPTVAGVAVNTETEVVQPSASTAAHSVFMGVTVRHNESATRELAVQRSGDILVRVKGPVSVHGDLVLSPTNGDVTPHDYLVAARTGATTPEQQNAAFIAFAPGRTDAELYDWIAAAPVDFDTSEAALTALDDAAFSDEIIAAILAHHGTGVGSNSGNVVAKALQAIAAGEIRLIQARTGAAGGGGKGGIQWRGQWDAEASYVQDDVVIRALDAEIDDGNLVGTFIAKRDIPDGSQPQWVPKYPLNTPTSDWDLLALVPNERLVMRGGFPTRNQTIELDAGKSLTAASLPKLILTANRNDVTEGPRLDMDLQLFYGKIIKPVELRVCEIDPGTGARVNGYRMFACSDFYTTPVTPEEE